MRRFFVKNLLFVVTVNMLVKPAWIFLIDRTVQNRVGHEAYGTYGALFNICVIFQVLLDFGLTNYTSKTIAQYPDKLAEVFPSMFSARLVLATIYVTVVSSCGFIMGYRGWEIWLLAGILTFQVISSLLQFLRSNVAGLHKFKTDGILSILDRSLMIVVCGTLLLIPITGEHFRIEWFVWTQIGCYAAAALAAYFVLRRISKVRLRFNFHAPTVLKIIRESLPYAVLIFLMSVYTRSDQAIIERLLGPEGKEQNGIYIQSYRWLDVANMFPLMFASMLLPLFGRMLINKNNIQPIIQLCVNILLPFSLMIAVAASFYGDPIMHKLYTHSTPEDGTIFAILMATFPAFCMMYVYSTLLTANGSLKLLNTIAVIGVIVNLSLNFYLVPQYKAMGAAAATVITQTLLAILFIICSGRKMQLPVNIKWIASHFTFLVLTVTIAYLSNILPLNWYLKLGFYGTVSLVLMFSFGFISIRAIKQLAER